jgi:thiol-disulfide isomerase/thioredoxin
MDKSYRLVIIVVVSLILSGLVYLLVTREASAPLNTSTEAGNQSQVPPDTSPPPNRGTFTSYSADNVAATEDTALLFFHAPWCPQCRALEASIDTTGVPQGVTIFKVDYDSNQALRQKYGVTIQTTVVKIDDSGEKVDSFVAYDDPSLEAVERELLR